MHPSLTLFAVFFVIADYLSQSIVNKHIILIDIMLAIMTRAVKKLKISEKKRDHEGWN